MKFTGHWLRYSMPPNLPTLSSQSSQAINLALIIIAETFIWSLLCSNSDHRRVLTPIYQPLALIMGQFLNKNAQIWHTRANMTTNWQ